MTCFSAPLRMTYGTAMEHFHDRCHGPQRWMHAGSGRIRRRKPCR